MAIYKAPDNSFLGSYMDSARDQIARGDQRNKNYISGTGDLVKGAAEAYKYYKRGQILDKDEDLAQREQEIVAELSKLKAQRDAGAKKSYMESILSRPGWEGVPYKTPQPEPWQGIPYKRGGMV